MPFDATSPEAEVAAASCHFRAVLQLLRAKRPKGLAPAWREVRRLRLDELEAYAARRGRATSLPLSKADAIKASISPTPKARADYLASLDDAWDDEPNCGGVGCEAADLGASSPASLTLLASVIAAIAGRRGRE